ncbi:hypothetical protein P7K49_037166 [Saguinus oedipus]|uniref:HTH cro/C1-type domain-containing protein n=1 Tax=Saguinus oedipus TaxID=9490 RepID=A0ABQ9THA8_SAGOE|nr:hypothetical protein P7K49_037166 [Saguinus oedipus]
MRGRYVDPPDNENQLSAVGADLMGKNLAEIQNLRQRLEESITINDSLRERLEPVLSHGDQGKGQKNHDLHIATEASEGKDPDPYLKPVHIEKSVAATAQPPEGRPPSPATAEIDWDTVTVLRKKGPMAAQAKSKQAVSAAQRRGEDAETSKKWAAGQNKQHSITKNTAKLDRATEQPHRDRVTLEVGKVIQQGQQSKGLTQKDLATKINEKPQVIADYESGRAILNNQVLGKIERATGLKLRGKDIGKPIDREGAQDEMNTKPRNQCAPADLVLRVPLGRQHRRGSPHRPSGTRGPACRGLPSPFLCQTNKTLQSEKKKKKKYGEELKPVGGRTQTDNFNKCGSSPKLGVVIALSKADRPRTPILYERVHH